MSKLKTPREKKLASLALDRRNVYGENDKASRKGIPRSKQLSHQASRRAAKQPLITASPSLDEDSLVDMEAQVISREIQRKRNAFKKKPDAPLGEFIERQAYWAKRRDTESDYWAARRPDDTETD